MLFVGNKGDLGLEERFVLKEDVAEWVFCELPKLRAKVTICLSTRVFVCDETHIHKSCLLSLSLFLYVPICPPSFALDQVYCIQFPASLDAITCFSIL